MRPDMMADGGYKTTGPVFSFEKALAFDEARLASSLKYIADNFYLTFLSSSIYVLFIFSAKYYMSNRPRMGLRPLLVIWSGLLAVFSIMGALRTIPELIFMIQNHGLQYSVCMPNVYREIPGLWLFMFTVSKMIELGDTVFIVLRKQPLIFLHWYHHVTALTYAWYTYSDETAPARWFMTINFSIHALMYTYYTLRALRVPVPRVVNVVITLLQLIQMVVGCALNIWVYQIKNRGEICHQSYQNITYSFIMYGSYFALFAHFFYRAYIKSTSTKTKSE